MWHVVAPTIMYLVLLVLLYGIVECVITEIYKILLQSHRIMYTVQCDDDDD